MERKIKIAYIGGGSKLRARTFMSDLAVAGNLSGEIALYDIDMKAAERNAGVRIIPDKRGSYCMQKYCGSCTAYNSSIVPTPFISFRVCKYTSLWIPFGILNVVTI